MTEPLKPSLPVDQFDQLLKDADIKLTRLVQTFQIMAERHGNEQVAVEGIVGLAQSLPAGEMESVIAAAVVRLNKA